MDQFFFDNPDFLLLFLNSLFISSIGASLLCSFGVGWGFFLSPLLANIGSVFMSMKYDMKFATGWGYCFLFFMVVITLTTFFLSFIKNQIEKRFETH